MRRNDEFDDDPRFAGIVTNLLGALDIRDRIGARSPLFAVLMVAGTLAVLAAVLWYSYPKEAAEHELRAVPIVRADAGPIKIIPSDPGGMDIPYRDSTVFDTLHASKNRSDRIENLLPEPEKPLPRGELFAGLKTDMKTDLEINATLPTPEKPVMPAVKPEKTEAEKAAKTEPAAGTPKDKTSGGDYYVQLGSLRSRADAERAWKDSQGAFPGQLGGLDLRINEADLGAKGTYYRVQGGPVSQQSAQSICKAVEAKKPGGCLVVRR